MDYKLEDLVDVPLIQDLQNKLNAVYSFPSAIIDLDGKILTSVAWQDICTKFHRVNPKSEKECIKSDEYIKEHLKEAKPSVSYTCPHGLIDNATPIIIEGKHLGNFFTGQFFLEKPDLKFFKAQAKEFGFKEKEYLEAVKKVPIWTKDKLDKYLDFIKGFIEIVAGMGLKNLREIEANKKIKESEEQYRTIIETAMDGFWINDLKGKILDVNETYCRMSGYSRNELLAMSIPDIEAKESAADTARHMKNVIENGEVLFETKHHKKDGSVFEIEISVQYRNVNGGQFVAFIRDITKRKQYEKSIRENEEKFRLITENTSDTITVLDLDLNFTYFSPSIGKLRGFTPEEAMQHKVEDILTPESLQKVMTIFESNIHKVLAGVEEDYPTIELEEYHKNGSTIWVELSFAILKDVNCKPIGIITVTRDISERKKSESILHEIIENNPMSIQIVDKDGCSLKTNPAHTALFGAVPPPDFSIFKDLEQKGFAEYIALAKSGKEARFPDLCYNVHDISPEFPDNPAWIRSLIFPLKDSKGIPERYVIMHENVNEAKSAEQRIEKQLLYITALNQIAEVINTNENPEEILENANRIVGETLKVDRTLIYDVSFDEGHITGMCEWLREEHPDIEHTKDVYPIDMFISPFTQIRESKTYLTSHSNNINEYYLKDGSGKILHEGFKIKSLIWYPLAFDEHGYYLFTINQILKHRKWTKEEISFLESVAKQVSLALMKIRMLEERKDIEAKLKLNLERLELATKFSEMGIWDWDMENNQLEWTKEMFVLFGLDINSEATFELWETVLHPEDKEITYIRIQNAIDEKIQLQNEYRVVYPDGQLRWISAIGNTTYNESGKPVRMNGVCIDITKRKLAEEEIESNHNLLLKLSNQVPGVIYQYRLYPDGSSCFPYASNGMSMIYEYLPEEVREDATPVFGRLHPEDYNMVSELIMDSAKTLRLFLCEFRVILPVQGLRWRYSTAVPERMEDGSTLWHGIIYDITDRKKTEEELIFAKEQAEESERLKSAFLANMSHEIRTPMNGILGFAQLLKEPKLTGEEQSKYIEVIERSGRRMLNIINDIVDIARIESGQMKVKIAKTNVNKQVDYLHTFFKPEVESKGMILKSKASLSDAEADINSDREKIYAVLTNLVKNAIKYSNDGTIEFGYVRKDKFLEFFVKDTGIGISAERHEAIFERFVQADVSDTRALQGAGLGLAITKAYVEMLGGKIWVESEESKGSTFYFTIPYDLCSIVNTTGKRNDSLPTEETEIIDLKILIAEDDEACEILLKRAIKKYYKEIISVSNGIAAVENYKMNPDIDLILMDIKMPGIDGYEATRQIRKINKDVIIIAQTAFALAGDREKAIEAGCNDYIAKPIKSDLLLEMIEKYFGTGTGKK
jgi:PAS domain S-box-containing protein